MREKRIAEIARTEGMGRLFQKAASFLLYELTNLPCVLSAAGKVNTTDPGELVDFSFNSCNGYIRPLQVEEIRRLLSVVAEEKPGTVIEIGTATGGTLFLFCRTVADDASIISIDLPGGKFGGGYFWWRVPLYKKFRKLSQTLHLIQADSHADDTLQRVRKTLDGKKADLLFIDGDHSYAGVKMDFEKFSPLVRDGGLIAFHDIVVHPDFPDCGADRFWNEIKAAGYKCSEIVSDWKQGTGGIGLLRWQIKS